MKSDVYGPETFNCGTHVLRVLSSTDKLQMESTVYEEDLCK